MPIKTMTKTDRIREKCHPCTDDNPQQGSKVLDPAPPTNELHASTIMAKAGDPCPQTPTKQIGLQWEEPGPRGKTQTERGTRGLASPDSTFFRSPLHFSTPEGKKPDTDEIAKKEEVSRLLKDALHLIHQAAVILPNLNVLAKEVKRAQEAPSTYEIPENPAPYKDALLKNIEPKNTTPLPIPQHTLILKVERLDSFDPQQARDEINKALGAKKVATNSGKVCLVA
ncbi:hypothetical protein F5Y16DRAFT_30639 [Xylariaceae sp. FL0255]|nr:hypothetical protein F5Y16DRAFT_30639 [Xylariaceae sp. FL0255]